jgi:hypothetical protein
MLGVCLLVAGMVQASVYDIGTDATATFDSATDTLTNTGGITAWTDSGLKISSGSDLSNVDFTALGITSWSPGTLSGTAVTKWDGANLSGITLNQAAVNIFYNDSMVGLNFSNAIFNQAGNQPFLDVNAEGANFSGTKFNFVTATQSAFRNVSGLGSLRNANFSGTTYGAFSAGKASFFGLGPGTTSAADKDNAATFVGADFSLLTGNAKTYLIANMGKFDGATAIGAKYDQDTLTKSGWAEQDLIDAGWQKQALVPEKNLSLILVH